MTAAVKNLVERFEQLSMSEQREVVREILCRSVGEAYGALSDDVLTEIAEESFLGLDRHEASDARSEAR